MVENRIEELGFELPEVPKPIAAYIPALVVDKLVFTAGQLPMEKGKLNIVGKLGDEVSDEKGRVAAEICALNCLSVIKSVIDDLDRIERVVKLTVFVNSAIGFTGQSNIANGASELIRKIFGDKGKHVRSAIGVNELPLNSPVEIEMIVRVK